MAVATRPVFSRKYTVAAPTSGRASAASVIGWARAAEQMERQPGALHGDDERRHAEQRAIERVAFLAVQVALAEGARRRDEHRLVRTEQQQRREVHRIRHRHRRAAGRERQLHLERPPTPTRARAARRRASGSWKRRDAAGETASSAAPAAMTAAT